MTAIRVFCRRCGIEYKLSSRTASFVCQCKCPAECPECVRIQVQLPAAAPPEDERKETP